jgi:hypothetical protein
MLWSSFTVYVGAKFHNLIILIITCSSHVQEKFHSILHKKFGLQAQEVVALVMSLTYILEVTDIKFRWVLANLIMEGRTLSY